MVKKKAKARDRGCLLLKPVWSGLWALHQVECSYLTAQPGSSMDDCLLCVPVLLQTRIVRLREPGWFADFHTAPQWKRIKNYRDKALQPQGHSLGLKLGFQPGGFVSQELN